MVHSTLCFIFEGNPYQRILLGYKKRGFGQGKIDGFGGKLGDGESPEAAAARELEEESGITAYPADLIPVGVVTFTFPNKPGWDHEVHVFVAQKWVGTPVESEEMIPAWYDLASIPYDQMWDDSHHWLPHVLAGERIQASFTMNPDNETVRDFTLQLL